VRLVADRRMLPAAAVAAVTLLCLYMMLTVRSLRAENTALLAKQKELASMKDDVVKLKSRVEAAEARTSLAKVAGVVQAIDEIVKSMGLSQKVKSVKPTNSRERLNTIEEEAEVQLEKLTLNELVNLLYRFENAPMLLATKKTYARLSFENPSLLNVTCFISLIRPAQNQAQKMPPK